MLRAHRIAWMLAVGAMVMGGGTVFGQTYPHKPIRIITSEAGGGNDVVARQIAQGIAGRLGQPVITDNRGIVGFVLVAKATPDGHTLLFNGTPMWIGPLLETLPYDPVRDFSPVTLVIKRPNVLAVSPLLPVQSVKDLIALAKAKPGELNYSMTGAGTANHLAAALFQATAGLNVVAIAYKGSAPALIAVASGEVHFMFPTTASATQFAKSGKLKALAVTSAEPSALAPGLPTVAASGLPGFESVSTAGVFAPARTPPAIISRVNQEIVRFLTAPETKEMLLNAGAEVVASTPEVLGAAVKSEMAKYGKLIRNKEAGIRNE